MKNFINRTKALERLQVKPQTLYAYVSRGRIRREPDPEDYRRSLYSVEDIEAIVTQKVRGKKPAAIATSSMSWGEPSIATSLSFIHQGNLYYRGVNAVEFAHVNTLEMTASLLWDVPGSPFFTNEHGKMSDIYEALGSLATVSPSIMGRSKESLAREAQGIIGLIAQICGAAPIEAPIHDQLARGWGCDAAGAEHIRQALVLMVDHDLNASTFATRVAASTGASLPACLLAGLCTLSGPRHGGASKALDELVIESQRLGAADAVRSWLSKDQMLPGFGHKLYPEGDPRARAMLSGLTIKDELKILANTVFAQTNRLPNCDLALAVMAQELSLPISAPFYIFLLARSVGWCAHAMEQNLAGTLIRPRGIYEGPMPCP